MVLNVFHSQGQCLFVDFCPRHLARNSIEMSPHGPLATRISVHAPGLLRRFLKGVEPAGTIRDGFPRWRWRLLDWQLLTIPVVNMG